MKLRWAALAGVLALGAFMPATLTAQSPSQPSPGASAPVELGQNYPNPFDLDTRIPFTVGGPPQCQEQGRLYRVTLRIYNILSQLVAIPVLQGGSGPTASGQPLENVLLPCDRYVAYWDGKAQSSTAELARGIYIYRLEVDGKPYVKRMFLRK